MYWLLFSMGAALLAAIFASVYWQQVASEVAGWLRSRGLAKTALMDAWVWIDYHMTKVRSRIFIKDHQGQAIQISVKTLSPEQVDDPEVRALLDRQGSVYRNIMPIVQ
ncbi:MAG TPA: hypothetical protein VKK31_15020 [Thermoanaerobaculia bacterium]|nr:hypothetical protein [Thermoanaerobaculia bacterium]